MSAGLPKISVVIPCYNAVAYVAEAVRSVDDQGWPELEIIVVDDGSIDGSADVVAAAFPGIRVIRQSNAGVAAARNAGLREATGDWIAFLDADDLWLPGKLRAQWDQIASEPDVRLAYSAWIVWESSDAQPDESWLAGALGEQAGAATLPGPSGWIYPDLLLDCEVWTSTVLAQRDLLMRLGGFDETLRIGEDYDLWLRVSRETRILRLQRPTALYRIHSTNTTRAAPRRNFQAEVVSRAIARWGYASPDGRLASRTGVNRSMARTWRSFAGAHLQAGNRATALSGALRALRFDPGAMGGWKLFLAALMPLGRKARGG